MSAPPRPHISTADLLDIFVLGKLNLSMAVPGATPCSHSAQWLVGEEVEVAGVAAAVL